jgi:Fe-S cluster assembly protein SufB
MTTTAHPELEGLDRYKFGWADSDAAGESARRGLSEEVVRDISAKKNEPGWMLDLRLKGLQLFGRKPMPDWGSDLSGIDFASIKYFVRSTEKQAASWDELPADIKNTYDKLGIPEAEKQRLIVRGFVEPIACELPMEYALELDRLIELQMEGAVG